MAIGIYNQSNPQNYNCGTVDIETGNYDYKDVTTMNFTVPEGDVWFEAKPAEGYKFKGFYIGVVGSSHYVETPSDELLSDTTEYACDAGEVAICAVFECEAHQWDDGTVSKAATCKEAGTKVFKCKVCGTEKTEEIAIDPNAHVWQEKVQKATPTSDGRIYRICSECGEEEMVAPLLKVSKISLAGTSYTYTGKAITPKATVANSSEELSTDVYDVTYSNNTNVGTATVKITLKGDYYEGTKSLTFKINKAANPLAVKPKTVKVKSSKLKKKSQTLAVTKVIKFTMDAKDKKTYTLVSVRKGSKSFKKYFKINKTTGKISIKRNSKMKKGTYKVKVKVKATGDANYDESLVKTVTFKVKVK